MCGLVGMVGSLEHKHKQVMKEMLFLNTLRGKDSTGLTAIKRDRTVVTKKMTVPGYEFIEHPAVEKTMLHGDQLWLGHGRYRTAGEVNKANAHPFEVCDENDDVLLVGTHNGTLHNKWELERLIGGDKFDTDSEALFNWFIEADNYKKAVAELKGAWSLVWWDPTTDSLHFCRNEERPLIYAYTKDRKVLLWASESWMLLNVARRNGLELDQNKKGLSCYLTLTDHLYTLNIPQERGVVLPDLIKEGGYVGKPTTTFQTPHYKNHTCFGWWEEEKAKRAKEAKEREANQTKETGKKVVSLGGVRGFNGELISLDKLAKISDSGCAWCGGEIKRSEITAFLDEERLVCVRCMRDTHPKTFDTDVDDDEEDWIDPLNDDFPFDVSQKDSPEYKTLIEAAVKGSAKKAAS